LVNPKGSRAYKNLFDMTKKKNFVAATAMSGTSARKPSGEMLAILRMGLEAHYPTLKKIRVKRYYDDGRILVRATAGKRKIRVTGKVGIVLEQFNKKCFEIALA
jgi:hypothetical protein